MRNSSYVLSGKPAGTELRYSDYLSFPNVDEFFRESCQNIVFFLLLLPFSHRCSEIINVLTLATRGPRGFLPVFLLLLLLLFLQILSAQASD